MTLQSTATVQEATHFDRFSIPDKNGRFGPYGGSYVPETLCHPLRELTNAYEEAKQDPDFRNTLNSMLKSFAG